MKRLFGLVVFAVACAVLVGCQSTDPLTRALRGRAVFIAGQVAFNMPGSLPTNVSGSSAVQTAGSGVLSVDPATGEVSFATPDGAVYKSPSPINNMQGVNPSMTKEFDVGAALANLQGIERSTASTPQAQSQRESTGTSTGTSGDVTAPATTTVSPSVPVSVTGQGNSDADATAPPAPAPAETPAVPAPAPTDGARLATDPPEELVAGAPTNKLSEWMDATRNVTLPIPR